MRAACGEMDGRVVLATGETSSIGKAAALAAEGADTIVYLARAPEAEWMRGKCLAGRRVNSSADEPHDVPAQERLWAESAKLTGAGNLS